MSFNSTVHLHNQDSVRRTYYLTYWFNIKKNGRWEVTPVEIRGEIGIGNETEKEFHSERNVIDPGEERSVEINGNREIVFPDNADQVKLIVLLYSGNPDDADEWSIEGAQSWDFSTAPEPDDPGDANGID